MEHPPQYASSDEKAILAAYTSAVTRLQHAIAVAVARSDVFVEAGQAPPFAAVFRSLESASDSYGFTVASTSPEVATRLTTQTTALASSEQQAIDAYSSPSPGSAATP